MEDNSIIINVSRGEIIDESILIDRLNNGKFKGVALDVFYEEPLPQTSELWNNSKVIVTPHNAYVSDNTDYRMVNLIYKNLEKFISNSELSNSVN